MDELEEKLKEVVKLIKKRMRELRDGMRLANMGNDNEEYKKLKLELEQTIAKTIPNLFDCFFGTMEIVQLLRIHFKCLGCELVKQKCNGEGIINKEGLKFMDKCSWDSATRLTLAFLIGDILKQSDNEKMNMPLDSETKFKLFMIGDLLSSKGNIDVMQMNPNQKQNLKDAKDLTYYC